MREYFKSIENSDHGATFKLNNVIGHLTFNEFGLIPVVTQDADTREVLMLAWMNSDALERTLTTSCVTYWSRSRNKLWVKGETTEHYQKLLSMSFDCDGDTILCRVQQLGAACHTGRPSCFYLSVDAVQRQIVVNGNAKLNR